MRDSILRDYSRGKKGVKEEFTLGKSQAVGYKLLKFTA